MNYKYRKGQIFRKKLAVPKNIEQQIYNCTLSLNEYFNYDLADKIPISCLNEQDRIIIKNLGVSKCKHLDWELINTLVSNNIDFRTILASLPTNTEDVNTYLYAKIKNTLPPSKYSSRMKAIYTDSLFTDLTKYDDSLKKLLSSFNNGKLNLKQIVSNWSIFKDKDLSYCLLHDNENKFALTNDMLKQFMTDYSNLAPLIMKNTNIYEFITNVSKLSSEEKFSFIKNFTDKILKSTENEHTTTTITSREYQEIFKYSSLEEYLKKINSSSSLIIEQLQTLPENYIFTTSIPFSELLNYKVLDFISTYGLKNVVDFDNECDHFFTKNNYEMLNLMYDMYMHYSSNETDPNKKINTHKIYDENGTYLAHMYTKDEFYEAMRRMIIYGPTDSAYINNAPDYRNMTGEFRHRNPNLFISQEAPQPLQELFYSKSLTPHILIEHPEYIEYLKGKNFNLCFKEISIDSLENDIIKKENLYEFLSSKTDFNTFMNFISEYADIFDIIFDDKIADSTSHKIGIIKTDSLDQIEYKINQYFRNIMIEQNLTYPKNIPTSLKKQYKSMFLDENAPEKLQDAFYNRTISPDFILENPSYKEYLKNIDLELLFKYKPITKKDISKEEININSHYINLIEVFSKYFGDYALDVILLYEKYLNEMYEVNSLKYLKYDSTLSANDFLDDLDKILFQGIIDGKLKYNEQFPSHFKYNNKTLFLDENIPEEIKNKFYNRQFTLKDFNDNPNLLELFNNTNIACSFPENMAWIIPLFSDSESITKANYNRLKIISEYSKIQDKELQKIFKNYITNYVSKIDINKIEYASQILLKLSLSNSSEMFTFRKELATELLKADNPLESLAQIEDLFVKNNIPVVGKIYSCFEILHPDFKGFNFENSTISPVLKTSSVMTKKVIVFSDLIKATFGSNNRSVNSYLKNIEIGSNLYENIKSQSVNFDSLSADEKKELLIFSNHLATLYNNTAKAKKSNEKFKSSGNILDDILELSKKLSPDGSLNYNLADRVIKMFCGFAGIDTLQKAKSYINEKIAEADTRNKIMAKNDMTLERGDFIKGIGDIKYLRNILQNGSVSKEFLGSSAESDCTPLDTDVSMILSEEGSTKEKINRTIASNYGPILFVLKNNARFMTTKTNDTTPTFKKDMSKLEVFYTGEMGKDHYGIRTGFASSEIDYIVMDNYDSRVGLEIAMNGFYIPVANKDGKIIFTPKDYEQLRSKMTGISYFGTEDFSFSENLVTEETKSIVKQIDESNSVIAAKKEKINDNIKKSLEELGLKLKTNIDGDLTEGFVELIDTGSTGRQTNALKEGDFDFIMRLDKKIFSDYSKLSQLKQTLLKNFGKQDDSFLTSDGDFRLKSVKLADNTTIDIDITFVEKTDKIFYSTDMALQDRLSTIKTKDPLRYNYVIANILLAKDVLKKAGAYKPDRGDNPQGGLGGVGIENWILQHGGSFVDAANSFLEAAEGRNFSSFESIYEIWDFGDNYLASKKGNYPHDNFVTNNMNATGYEKTIMALKEYLKQYKASKLNLEEASK